MRHVFLYLLADARKVLVGYRVRKQLLLGHLALSLKSRAAIDKSLPSGVVLLAPFHEYTPCLCYYQINEVVRKLQVPELVGNHIFKGGLLNVFAAPSAVRAVIVRYFLIQVPLGGEALAMVGTDNKARQKPKVLAPAARAMILLFYERLYPVEGVLVYERRVLALLDNHAAPVDFAEVDAIAEHGVHAICLHALFLPVAKPLGVHDVSKLIDIDVASGVAVERLGDERPCDGINDENVPAYPADGRVTVLGI